MHRQPRKLPPLDALVFFESAGRHLSFTRAARELSVSQTAVSKRIRQLESFLELKLFVRDGRSLSFTVQGQELLSKTSLGLDFLASALSQLRASANRVVRIAASNTIAVFWVQDQLKRFALTERACPINFVSSDDTSDLTAVENDLVVLPWNEPLEAYDCTALFRERLVPVAAPALAQSLALDSRLGFLRDRDGHKQALLDYPRVEPFWSDWTVWSNALKLQDIERWPRKACKTYAHAIGQAVKGEGIALGSLELLSDELADGALLQVSELSYESPNRYFLARHPATKGRGQVDDLHQFLVQAALGE